MKSISRRILRTSLYWLIIIVSLITTVSIVVVNKISSNDSADLISQICEKETLRFNNEFDFMENSVKTIAKYLQGQEEDCSSLKEMLTDDFSQKLQDLTLSIANRTNGAMAVYFRYNPEITGNGTQGFFWSRDNDYEDFTYFEPTDILQYDQSDTEHVGWFYEPKKTHEPIWMTPYFNKNLNVFMISYIIPYYTKWGDFLGVIGMDIDFNKIVQLTSQVSLYKTGKINLIDLSTCYMYGIDKHGFVSHKILSSTLYKSITAIENSKPLKLTNDDGVKCLTSISSLSNGMRLMLSVPVREINAQRNYLIIIFAIITAVALLVTIFFIIHITNKIVDPLKKLTRITEKYANGDWNETFISHTGDEIQELSESISTMANMTKSYIKRLDARAMTDELTGLKNKNCYLSYIPKFKNENYTGNGDGKYAIVVFDINYLKKVNDNFGHETGDSLIILAGEYICNIFGHSPVFRIGGDEYNVILENRDYKNRKELCRHFEQGMKDLPPVAGDIPLSISYGMAAYPKDGASYDEVFKCADERMYEFKKAMKAGRE